MKTMEYNLTNFFGLIIIWSISFNLYVKMVPNILNASFWFQTMWVAIWHFRWHQY